MNYLVSIILPVYNGEAFLTKAIDSCLQQTYGNFELIIVNDCSTDNSGKIAENYKLQDSRIKVIHNRTNKKLPASLNIGHQAANGEYFTWTSDDNLLKSNFLKTLMASITLRNADIAFANYDIISSNGLVRREHVPGPLSHLLFGNTIGAAFLYNKKVFQTLNGYNEQFHLIEDYDFWLRASTKFKFIHIDANIYKYRVHKNSLSVGFWFNPDKNKQIVELTAKVYSNFCNDHNFSRKTANFLFKLNRKQLTFVNYQENFRIVKRDLQKYDELVKGSCNSSSLDKLNQIVRNYFKSDLFEKSPAILLWLMRKQPGVLFSGHYSKKESFRLIFAFLRLN
ncbi:MAG: glycosyltransferase [Flavobacteriaceae bacterium]|nr:glycosyltransferase [Flavobacteriaceae bacterium]